MNNQAAQRPRIPRLPAQPSVRAGMYGAVLVALILLVVFFAWPVAAMLLRGAGSGALHIFAERRTWILLRDTLCLAAAGTFGSLILGIPCAYVLYTKDFPGRRFLRAFVSVPFVLPTVVVGVAFTSLLGKGGAYEFLGIADGPWAVISAMIFFNVSVITRTVGSLWASLDPRYVEAARMLGASSVRAFLTVTLASLRPAVASGASLVFLFCSTAYGIVITLGGIYTLESEIWSQTNRLNFDSAAGLSLIQFAIVMIALAISTRAGKTKTQRIRHITPTRLQPADIPALVVTLGVVLFLILAPLASLVVRSFQIRGEWTYANYAGLASTGTGFSGGTTVLEALANSLHSSLLVTALSLFIGVPLAYVLSRPVRHLRHGRLLHLVEIFAMAPLGVSAVTLGFGYLIALQAPPLRLGASAVPLAQTVVVIPMVLRALLPILRSVNPRLRDAAMLLGASPVRVLATVDTPLAARGFALAAGFAFAMSLGEFGASSFLANGSNVTLPVLISRLVARPGGNNYGMALASSVILALLTVIIMMMCESGRKNAS